jgi:hypothetical protein
MAFKYRKRVFLILSRLGIPPTFLPRLNRPETARTRAPPNVPSGPVLEDVTPLISTSHLLVCRELAPARHNANPDRLLLLLWWLHCLKKRQTTV